MALVTGLLLFVAAYDFVESLAQEIDKPTLWANKPIPAGDIVVRLTLAGAACMAPVVVISILAALIVGGGDIAAIALMTLPATAIAAAVGAAVSTALGAPTMSATTMQSEMFALTTVPRILAPPAIAVIPMLPVVAGLVGDSPGGVTGIDSLFLMGVTCGLAMLWLRKRHPEMT
jgi:hypothetical protein